MSIRIAPVLPSLLLVALLCGCASGGEGSTRASDAPALPEPTLGSVPNISDASGVIRPIDAYLPDTQHVLEMVQAHESQVNRCLGENGFSETFSFPAQEEVIAFVDGVVTDRVARSSLWGFFGVNTARTRGYQREGETGSLTVPPLSDAASAACLAPKEGASDPIMFAFEGSLPSGGPPVPREDSRFLEAVQDWSKCMADNGFQYSDVLDPLGEYQSEPVASQRQIATATADIDCKVSTNLVGIAVAVQAAYDQRYIESNFSALDDYRAQMDEFLREGATP